MTDWVFTCQSLVNWYCNVTFVGGIVLNNLSNVSFNESSNNTFGKSVSSLFRFQTKLVNECFPEVWLIVTIYSFFLQLDNTLLI